MHKSIYITLFAVLLLVSSAFSAHASDSELEIDRVEITAEGRTLLTSNGGSGNLDADPGDTLRLEVKLRNNYDDDTDNTIEAVRVDAYIEDIDDGDDVDDSEETSVRADGTRTVTLKLKIPEDASSYESYDLVVRACGEDLDGIEHCDDVEYNLEVKRESHELIFGTLQVSDAYCGSGDVNLRVEIINTGEQEEEEIELEVIQPELGTLYRDTFDLVALGDSDDHDSTYYETMRLDVDRLGPGTHTLRVRVAYDYGLEMLEKSIDFNVASCDSRDSEAEQYSKPRSDTIEQEPNPRRDTSFLFGTGDTVVVQTPPAGVPVPNPPLVPAAKESWFGTFALLLGNIALIVFIVLIIRAQYD